MDAPTTIVIDLFRIGFIKLIYSDILSIRMIELPLSIYFTNMKGKKRNKTEKKENSHTERSSETLIRSACSLNCTCYPLYITQRIPVVTYAFYCALSLAPFVYKISCLIKTLIIFHVTLKCNKLHQEKTIVKHGMGIGYTYVWFSRSCEHTISIHQSHPYKSS